MDVKLTALEWAKEVQNKFILYFELFNDEFTLEAHTKTRGNQIIVTVSSKEDVNLKEAKNLKDSRSAFTMATRGCP